MENNENGSNIGRRRALQVIGVGITAVAGTSLLEGCSKPSAPAAGGGGGGGAAAPAATGACMDRVEVDEAAKNMRKILQYKEKSDNAEKKCSLCAQFEAGKYGDCGGCKLFAGGVNPEGNCLSFAPKSAVPGAAPAAPGAPAAPAAPGAPAKAG